MPPIQTLPIKSEAALIHHKCPKLILTFGGKSTNETAQHRGARGSERQGRARRALETGSLCADGHVLMVGGFGDDADRDALSTAPSGHGVRIHVLE